MPLDGALAGILETISGRHLALPPASPEELKRLASLGAPGDLLAFYEHSNGAGLHRTTESGGQRMMQGAWWRWVIRPIAQMVSVREIGYIQPESPFYERSRHWLGVADVQDGNYLSISVEPGHAGEVIDCFHETVGTPGYSSIIALSFTELMGHLVSSNEAFWLQKDHREYGVY